MNKRKTKKSEHLWEIIQRIKFLDRVNITSRKYWSMSYKILNTWVASSRVKKIKWKLFLETCCICKWKDTHGLKIQGEGMGWFSKKYGYGVHDVLKNSKRLCNLKFHFIFIFENFCLGACYNTPAPSPPLCINV